MTSALVHNVNGAVVGVYDVDAVSESQLETFGRSDAGGLTLTSPTTGDGAYTLVPATFTDAEPSNSVRAPFDAGTLEQWTVANGAASGPRRWQAVTPIVPYEVPKLWLVRAMRQLGWKAGFDAVLAQASADMREDWDLCSAVRRDDPGVAAIAAAMGKVSADIDELFITADRLQSAQ